MKAVVQRVNQASVTVDDAVIGRIGRGMLVLAAVCAGDTDEEVAWMAGKLAALRIFPSEKGAFDLDVRQAGGAVLLVSNFTVAAATAKGRRPSLDGAMPPAAARPVFDRLVAAVREQGVSVETGEFGAAMQVALVNDGPITFIVDSADR